MDFFKGELFHELCVCLSSVADSQQNKRIAAESTFTIEFVKVNKIKSVFLFVSYGQEREYKVSMKQLY